MEIVFTSCNGLEDIFPPEPAYKHIPEWYKNMESYEDNIKRPRGDGKTTATIKKCMPVFDAITSGYVIKSQADVYVSQKPLYATDPETGNEILVDQQPFYEWANFDLIRFHPMSQAPEHPSRNGHLEYPKWMNPWSIKTPKGYSVLITQPFHRESPFTILSGVVDTDKYPATINFPFVLNDIKFEGLIPAGTPIAQIIPFKRDDWNMKLGTIENLKEINSVTEKIRSTFFDGYRNHFRTNKSYK